MVETGSPPQDPGSWVLVPDPTRLQGSLVQRKEVLPGGSPGTSRPSEKHVSNLCGVLLLDGHAWDTFVRDISNPQPSPLHSEVQQKAERMEGKTVPGQDHFQAGYFHPQAWNTLWFPSLKMRTTAPDFQELMSSERWRDALARTDLEPSGTWTGATPSLGDAAVEF